ncbi:hypothetical protein NBRC111894_3194 [Sporolactobacillus inulinus]|uniref:Bacterial purine repressor N-terminal domain-containing protein n=1 Tax=Sporolactobacillus inulinus TaxID=2078 RepID=A0A4Y1ZFC1_9BACL|nr:hypothetical protein NBRC111894_3194 [Sporolactobacillus inulinus]
MKLKRSSRLVDMTAYLLRHPQQVISLSYFRNGISRPNPRSAKI